MLLVEQGREMFVRRPNGNSSVSSDPGERYIKVPEHGLSNSSSYDTSAVSGLSSPLQQNAATSGYPPVFSTASEFTAGDDSGESYIRLEDCYSGQPVSASSTLPVYSASHGVQIVSPDKASKQVCTSASFDVDAANRHKVEYCNEYRLGEHDSVFVSVNSNCSNASGVCKANDDDSDDNDDKDYCHYQYPTVRYSMPHSVLSEVSMRRSISEHHSQEPPYVNCSELQFDLNRNGRRELWPPVRRHGICCESVLTAPKLPELFCEHASSGHLLSSIRQHHEGTHGSDSWNSCRLYPCHSITCAGDDDDDDDDAHNYVNVPIFHSSVSFHQSSRVLSDSATAMSSGSFPDVISREAAWKK